LVSDKDAHTKAVSSIDQGNYAAYIARERERIQQGRIQQLQAALCGRQAQHLNYSGQLSTLTLFLLLLGVLSVALGTEDEQLLSKKLGFLGGLKPSW
jgi:hypothetical protein